MLFVHGWIFQREISLYMPFLDGKKEGKKEKEIAKSFLTPLSLLAARFSENELNPSLFPFMFIFLLLILTREKEEKDSFRVSSESSSSLSSAIRV